MAPVAVFSSASLTRVAEATAGGSRAQRLARGATGKPALLTSSMSCTVNLTPTQTGILPVSR